MNLFFKHYNILLCTAYSLFIKHQLFKQGRSYSIPILLNSRPLRLPKKFFLLCRLQFFRIILFDFSEHIDAVAAVAMLEQP